MTYRLSPASSSSAIRQDAGGDDEPPVEPSCAGWFDSSFDLRRGLEVTELELPWPDTEPVAGSMC